MQVHLQNNLQAYSILPHLPLSNNFLSLNYYCKEILEPGTDYKILNQSQQSANNLVGLYD